MRFQVSPVRVLAVSAALLIAAAMAAYSAISPTPGARRVSISSTGQEGNNNSFGTVGFSTTGRFVAFASDASNFYALDNNQTTDVFVRIRRRSPEPDGEFTDAGFTEIISISAQQRVPGDKASTNPSISGIFTFPDGRTEEGRYVAFQSPASNLVPGGSNGKSQIYIRDRRGQTIQASVNAAGALGDDDSINPAISGDGRFVAFESRATNLLAGVPNVVPDTNGKADIYVQKLTQGPFGLQTSVPERVSIGFGPNAPDSNGASSNPSISADGRFVAFQSDATNLVPGDTNGKTDIFVKDRSTGNIQLVSVSSTDPKVPASDDSFLPTISADGKAVAFVSRAIDLVADGGAGFVSIFVRDLTRNVTERISVSSSGAFADADSGVAANPIAGRPAISGDGRQVAFISDATNLVPGDTNNKTDVFVRDRLFKTTTRVNVSSTGAQANDASTFAAMSADGKNIGFVTNATTLTVSPSNGFSNVFAAPVVRTGGSGNKPPIADAGKDQFVFETDPVILDGSGSTDPEGAKLTFTWTQIAGTPVKLRLVESEPAKRIFDAPLVATSEDLVFQLVVSDGVNDSAPATVVVHVQAATPGTLSGRVEDASHNPVVGAAVHVVRTDGQGPPVGSTDGAGLFSISGVRVGSNMVTVTKSGFEPVSRTVDIHAGEQVKDFNFTLSTPSAQFVGTIHLADGTPVDRATVELLDREGKVLAAALSDHGDYRIADLDRTAVLAAVAVRVSHPGLITWTRTNITLTPSTVNRLDFQYGNLQVTVDTSPRSLRRKLDGTLVEVLLGDITVASNEASKRVRRLNFSNMPATTVRVRASNLKQRLTAAQATVTVAPGRGPTKVTLVLTEGGRF